MWIHVAGDLTKHHTLTLSIGQAIWVSVRTTLVLQKSLCTDHSS
jgi:hypothetical protein